MRLQGLAVLKSSINVLLVAIAGEAEVSVTVMFTFVDVAGIVNRYHTSARLPPLQLPVGLVVVFARYKSPAVEVQFPVKVPRLVAVLHVLFPACENKWFEIKISGSRKSIGLFMEGGFGFGVAKYKYTNRYVRV